MNYFKPASTLYHGTNPGTSIDEDANFAELLSATDGDENVIEGRVVYISPVSKFEYNITDGVKRQGVVQSYTLLDILAKQSGKPVYSYRVTAWNDQVTSRVFKKDEYYRVSNFAWKENTFPRRPAHQSCYDAHLKANSVIELIPHVPRM